jgi:eukaryotic-like serine/threonine-protein kinase
VTDEDRLVAGRYRLGTRLGSGAMGIVWQAHDERLHRTVAVKQLLLAPGLSAEQSEEARLRSMREGRIAARLSHVNAITVFDVAEHGGEPWLIMEYLPSQSLAAAIQERGPLPPVEVARIGVQVATALVAAHAAGIVHRDVKPANVLLGDDGIVKITDFGISRATGDVTVTATGMLAGTPAYLAPEVAKGQKPTPASDVYSLGSTLYASVEGHSPFGQGDNTLAVLYAVAAGKIDPPQRAGPLTPLLMRLLRVDPAQRPTMTEAKEALAAIAAGRSAPAAESFDPAQAAGAGAALAAAGPPVAAPPGRGPQMTRLNPHPFTEPEPSPPAGAVRRPLGPPAPAGPPPAASRPATASKRNARTIVVTVLAIVAAALVGILVANLLSENQQTSQSSPPPQSSQTSQPSTQQAPSSPAKQAPTVTGATDAPAQPSPADYVRAVQDYYALLPGNLDEAWSRLTAQARQRSGDRAKFDAFWNGIRSVEVQAPTAQGNRVDATLRFVTNAGAQSAEKYFFELVQRDGKLLIDNFQRVGGA